MKQINSNLYTAQSKSVVDNDKSAVDTLYTIWSDYFTQYSFN